MDFSKLTEKEKKGHADLMFLPLSSVDEIRDWIKHYLGLEIPIEITDPDSTSSPLDAIWQIYQVFKNNSGDVTPGAILLSCREGMKCQKKSTITMTYDGYKKIEDVKKGDKIWTGFSWQTVTETFDEGIKPALQVNLKGGYTSTGTPIHRYWCLRDSKEQWIAGKDLNPNTDLICLNVNTGFKNSTVTEQEKYEIGYFLGLLVGDGGLTRLNKERTFTLTNQDKYVVEFYKEFVKNYLKNVKVYEYKINYRISADSAIKQIKDWGLSDTYSWEKTIPSYAYSSLDAMKGFIAGVFDTDGGWDKKGDCFFEMTAGPLLDQIQVVLASMGVESSVRHNDKFYGIQKHLVSRLCIGQHEAAKLPKLGILFKAKKAQGHKKPKIPNCKDTLPITQVKELLNLCSQYGHAKIKNRKHKKVRTDQELYFKGVTCSKLSRLCMWMTENYEHGYVSEADMVIVKKYENILLNKWKTFTVTDPGSQYFYDLTVENEHSYWSNGLISHNTVSVSLLEILLLLHFQLDIAHAAAVESQSSVGIKYIESFMFKIEPLLKVRGWLNMTQNKRTIQYKTPEGKTPYIKVLICTPKGMNSLHANVLFLDELDLADPSALKEAKNIVGYSKGIYGMTVYLSTRKYAFGNMNAALDKAEEMHYRVFQWNILDVTERCPTTRHLADEPKVERYIAKKLPLLQISKEQFDALPLTEHSKYELLKDVHAGCLKCPLLPVCKMRLSQKPASAAGGFYKPIQAVIQKFRENDPDTAEAQLMCWKPGSEGLVFPRFKKEENKAEPNKTNVMSVADAYFEFTGTKNSHVSEEILLATLRTAGVEIYTGVDWGFTHDAVIVVVAKLPDGQIWVLDCFASPGLEFSDMLDIGCKFRDRYGPQKWFADPAYPSHLKSFNKNGMKCPSFTKDIVAGIEAVRSKIVSSTGKRLFKVIKTPTTQKLIEAMSKHRFLLDGAGNPTAKPDDEIQVADICDSLRYIGQNLFPVKGPQKPIYQITGDDGKPLDGNTEEGKKEIERQMANSQLMMNEISKRVEGTPVTGGSGRKGGFHFSF